jgi:recombination protein RecA
MVDRVPLTKKRIEVPDTVLQRLDVISAHVEKVVENAKVLRFDGPIATCPVIPSGSLQLDKALGVGGYPCGRIVEVFGAESSGKTTLTLHAIANAQRAGGIAAFIDAEHALDLKYAQALGVKTQQLLISQPDHGEQALQIVDHLLDDDKLKQGDIIVVDSVAALTPKAEIDGEIGDHNIGLHARLMSQSLRMLAAKVSRSGALLYFTNQTRDRIGPFPGKVTTGGNALKFYASVRIDICRIGSINEGGGSEDNKHRVANKVKINVVKNKMAPPFVQVESVIRFGEGISVFDELLDVGVELGVLAKSGSWYAFNELCVGQGRENSIVALRQNLELAGQIEAAIRKAL